MITASQKINALISKGFTQVHIAELTGLTQATISRIASGKHVNPKENAVLAIDRLYTSAVKKRSKKNGAS